MKNKILFFFLFLSLTGATQNQAMWWGNMTVNKIVDQSDLIFEGRIITDSPYMQIPPSMTYTYTRVLVLKQFKGSFKSDTIIVIYNGGNMSYKGHFSGMYPAYARKGDEGVFLVVSSQHMQLGINDPNVFDIFYGPGVSYVIICDKKDVVKEVYEPIEAVTGQKYIEVHPNMCATQKK